MVPHSFMVPKVHFDRNPVRSVSRPLSKSEFCALEEFEEHIKETIACRRFLKQCGFVNGCNHCKESILYITSTLEYHDGWYISRKKQDHLLTFVELSRSYPATRWVLEFVTEACLRQLDADRELSFRAAKEASSHSSTAFLRRPSNFENLNSYTTLDHRYSAKYIEQKAIERYNMTPSVSRLKLSQHDVWSQSAFRTIKLKRRSWLG